MSQEQKEFRRKLAFQNPVGFASPNYAERRKQPITYVERITSICQRCSNPFVHKKTEKRKYCSVKCSAGLREKSGRGKTGHYSGFFLRSTYELAYLIYHLDNNIPIKAFSGYFEYVDPKTNKSRKYYPDFFVNNTIIEIKGYKSNIDAIKSSNITEPYKILYCKDLQPIFDFVETKYSMKIKDLWKLYET
jgi:hypothetical protein